MQVYCHKPESLWNEVAVEGAFEDRGQRAEILLPWKRGLPEAM